MVTLQRCGRVWREGGAKPGVLWRSWWGERNIRCASFLFVPVEGQATPFTTHMHTWNRNLNVSPPHTGRTSPQPVMDCWLHIPLVASSSLRFVVITWLYTARAFVIYHTECNFLQLVQLVRFNPIIHNQRASFCKCTAKNWMLKHPPRCFSSGWLQACVLLFFFLLTINKDHQCLSDAAQPLNQKNKTCISSEYLKLLKF